MNEVPVIHRKCERNSEAQSLNSKFVDSTSWYAWILANISMEISFSAVDAMVWRNDRCVRIHILETFDTPTLSAVEYYSLLTGISSHTLHQSTKHLFQLGVLRLLYHCENVGHCNRQACCQSGSYLVKRKKNDNIIIKKI